MEPLGASFRDPSGAVVRSGGEILRVVRPVYQPHYERFMASGLCQALVDAGLLIPHTEVESRSDEIFKVLRPRQLEFVSYPYEWSFSQLKDAALTTLRIQKEAVARGMNLKDASAFNIQFLDGRPVFIDTLSFEILPEGRPWAAYQQFCRHFLAPLALMSRRDPRLGQLSRTHLDGVPLDLASKLLPPGTWARLWLLVHVHLHARSQRRHADADPASAPGRRAGSYSLRSLLGLIQSLESAVNSLRWSPQKAVWGAYYQTTVTGGDYVRRKQQVVSQWLERLNPRSVWDLGANTGVFSRLAAGRGVPTLAFDGDIDCVEIGYLEGRQRGERHLLPLLMDLTNPSPALGWECRERMAWLERGQPDLVMALALVHHLALANNLPLDRLADFFARLGARLIVEFVPKADSNARKLLRAREDIFPRYTREDFEIAFRRRFAIEAAEPMANSERVLYLMRRHEGQ